MRKVLVFIPLSNCHRLPIFHRIAVEEKAAGNSVSAYINVATPLLDNNNNVSLNLSAIFRHLDPLLYKNVYVGFPGFQNIWRILRRNRSAQEEFMMQANLAVEDLLVNYDFDCAYVWNGNFPYQSDFLKIAHKHNLEVRFVEVAWFDQSNTFYVDGEGVNGGSSIAKVASQELSDYKKKGREFCEEYQHKKLAGCLLQEEYILVPLQVETDSNIRLYSPFKTMKEFIGELARWIPKGQKVVVRKHPKSSVKAFDLPEGFSWSHESDLFKDIAKAKCVVGINSTVILQSLALGKPVMALGEGVWGGNPAIAKGSIHDDFVWPEYKRSEAFALLGYLVCKQKYYSQKIFNRQSRLKGILTALRLIVPYLSNLIACGISLFRKKINVVH